MSEDSNDKRRYVLGVVRGGADEATIKGLAESSGLADWEEGVLRTLAACSGLQTRILVERVPQTAPAGVAKTRS